ncbi:6-carboxyhexanoate--CoA ligase [Priestia endophytica]|uniref:6-carboxyhexanoate--CoA ligase n=1 Tax=Priestia endophytica DSM 13796 TaxID=1121089 RepID=A0A1I6BBK5_9BACI|nr:6-carboxyhexanoate--CoA ligase [Priestia endophytica]KYG26139.1 6-carboxyhexanoate--CoA ligase [Priestia endophytica]SFQ78157.1 6-carboxyhexanoate--CoA ligase [Priestia endophytica DSM 13796]
MRELPYYSVRMRASKSKPHEEGGKHISGGEQLVLFDEIRGAVDKLLLKSLTHSRGTPDFAQIQFEIVDEPIQVISPLTITTHITHSVDEGQLLAQNLLMKCGVPFHIIQKAYLLMEDHAELSGAILIDSKTGRRLDESHGNGKGIRVSRMDWRDENFKKWNREIAANQNDRLKEAITLASKVSMHQATVAELCWSDDPDYTTGYVASKKFGYQRITSLKEYGDEQGCRIFFVNSSEDITKYIDYLKKNPVLIQWEVNHD